MKWLRVVAAPNDRKIVGSNCAWVLSFPSVSPWTGPSFNYYYLLPEKKKMPKYSA